jgi:branched-chain amino acid transport system ATP-binding protein
MLKLVDIHTYYGASYVLQGISMEVKEGEAVALLGRNGVGKTTTLDSIIGYTPPRHGRIFFKEKEITRLPPYQISRMGLALVPQGRCIFQSLSCRENLTAAARGGRTGTTWTLDRVYSLFPVLQERSRHKGDLLSGGEQQMLAIARALMTNPDLILMDEPSEGLAPLIIQKLRNVIRELHSKGLSILLVEQNLNLALSAADHIYIMSKGAIVYECSASELRNDEEAKTKYLGFSSLWSQSLY